MQRLHELILKRNDQEASAALVELHRAYGKERQKQAVMRTSPQPASLPELSANVVPSALLKNETKLREKLEKLQREMESKLTTLADQQESDAVRELQALNKAQTATIESMQIEIEKSSRKIEVLCRQLEDSNSLTQTTAQQQSSLKKTIRGLEDENRLLKTNNITLERRLLDEKSKLIEQMNILTELVESLRDENNRLRASRPGTFTSNLQQLSNTNVSLRATGSPTGGGAANAESKPETPATPVPKAIVKRCRAHTTGHAVASNSHNIVSCGGNDGVIHVWSLRDLLRLSVTLKGTLREQSITACDINKDRVIVGAGSDKTCRVWKETRLVHHIAGHAEGISCTRLVDHWVVTSSLDRTIRLWDIGHQTYQAVQSFSLPSATKAVDVLDHGARILAGFHDGSLRFFDTRTGKMEQKIEKCHSGTVSGVSVWGDKVASTSSDGKIRVFDARMLQEPIVSFHERGSLFARAVWSPDGTKIASSLLGEPVVIVWETSGGGKELSRITDNADSSHDINDLTWETKLIGLKRSGELLAFE